MQLIRYDPDQALPLESGTRVTYIPVYSERRLAAMLLRLDRRADTGMRETGADLLLTVIAGAGQVRSGGHVADVQAGDVCVLPGNMRHTIWTSDSPMEAVLVVLDRGG